MPGAFFTFVRLLALVAPYVAAAPIRHHPRQAANPKLVVAHVIVGNTASYSVETWKQDIQLAQANGIDGFALNVGFSAPFTNAQVQNAFDAAGALGPTFKLFFSFDMAASSCATLDDAKLLRDKITAFSPSANMLRVNGKVFASTFAGESCAWGGKARAGWSSEFVDHPELTGSNAVQFAPAFFIDPTTEYASFGTAMQGAFNFNGGWPVNAYDGAHNAIADPVPLQGDTATDKTFLAALAALPPNADGSKKVYMTAVAPWFFTHFGADTFNKNFIFNCDDNMFVKRFQNLVADKQVLDGTDILQIVTWNDFGESHYLANPHTASDIPAGAQAWVDGLDHTPWLNMISYLSKGFKTGAFPTPSDDQLTIWARPHPKDATGGDPLGLPQSAFQVSDTLFATAFLTAPADVTLTTAEGVSKTFPGVAGINNFNVPLTLNGFIQGTITRASAPVLDVKPANFKFTATPPSVNFNAFVAGATAGRAA